MGTMKTMRRAVQYRFWIYVFVHVLGKRRGPPQTYAPAVASYQNRYKLHNKSPYDFRMQLFGNVTAAHVLVQQWAIAWDEVNAGVVSINANASTCHQLLFRLDLAQFPISFPIQFEK